MSGTYFVIKVELEILCERATGKRCILRAIDFQYKFFISSLRSLEVIENESNADFMVINSFLNAF